MKKYFCFHCQENTEPVGFWKVLFCPKCKHFITDNGEGFYRVCDNCGANLPADAEKCLKCGHFMEMENTMEQYGFGTYVYRNSWLNWLMAFLAFVFAVIVALGVLYVSIYVVAFVFVFAVAIVLFNMIRAWFHI